MIRAFSIIIGIILLLPGVCSLYFMDTVAGDIGFLIFTIPGLLISAGGVWLIANGGTKKRTDNEPS